MSDTNRKLAELLGMVACDGYEEISMGMAGGVMLHKKCDHAGGECFSTLVVYNLNGEIGGPPKYDTDLNAMRLVEQELEKRGLIEEYGKAVNKWARAKAGPEFDDAALWDDFLKRMGVYAITAPADVKAQAAIKVLEGADVPSRR